MTQSVVDQHTNTNERLSRAAEVLAASKPRRSLFEAIYKGRKQSKTVAVLSVATGLTQKQVLTHGRKLSLLELVRQDKVGKETAYAKVAWVAAHREKILSLAANPSKVKKALGVDSAPRTTINIGGIQMRDKYVTGQAGAVGPKSSSNDNHFQQVWIQSEVDLSALSADLAKLRAHLKTLDDSPEVDAAIGDLAKAEQAARSGDGPKVYKALQGIGRWVFDTAKVVGTKVAAEVIKIAILGPG